MVSGEIRDLAIVLAPVAALAWLFHRARPRRRSSWSHLRNQKAAARALATLAKIDALANPARAFGYLRALPPFVFEEMIMSEIEARGHAIRRSPRYTGDGGVDGFFELNGRRWFVQAKRYRRYVKPAHVQEFGLICEAHGARGIFVHTGKTGPASKAAENASPFVRVVSGLDLVRFFAGSSLPMSR